jgi:hypothetical protein
VISADPCRVCASRNDERIVGRMGWLLFEVLPGTIKVGIRSESQCAAPTPNNP